MREIARCAALALLLSAACGSDDTNHTSHEAGATEEPMMDAGPGDAATRGDATGPSTATPPGYTPPALLPEGYSPPSLLVLTGDEQLETFMRIEETYVTQTVARGAEINPMAVAAEQIAPEVTWMGTTYPLDALMEAARITGVLAVQRGEIVLERYALGRTADDRWTSFSVAKSLTSLLLGAAIQDGHIEDIDEPVTKYIPDLAGSGYDGVTIRQLITMTSGVQWNEDYADPESDVALSSFWPGEPGIQNPLVSYMRRLPRAAEPGTVFSYKTGETDIAGILVAYATGRGLAQYLSEKIWAPFGMEQDAVWIVDGGSIERGGCCISMTLRDYGRVGMFVLGGGVAAGKQVVPKWYLEEATSNQIKAPATGSYGYFWWISPDGSYAARGIFGQSIQIFPEEELIVVTNAAFPSATSSEHREAITALTLAIRSAAN